jgi:aryl-alcohol dehydrogenase-like predicted oxidoreductase
VDASLRRLQTDYIDLYQTHFYDEDTPIDETLAALDQLVQRGKVLYVGASNYPAWRFMEALWSADVNGTVRYDSLQPHYNLVHRAEFERELKAVCEAYEIGVLPYSPLAGGFLTGKYRRGHVPDSARAEGIQRRYFNERGWRTLDAVREVADAHGTTPVAVSLAWLLAQDVVTSPIIGANSVDQLQDSLAALNVELSAEQVEQLSEASAWEEKS